MVGQVTAMDEFRACSAAAHPRPHPSARPLCRLGRRPAGGGDPTHTPPTRSRTTVRYSNYGADCSGQCSRCTQTWAPAVGVRSTARPCSPSFGCTRTRRGPRARVRPTGGGFGGPGAHGPRLVRRLHEPPRAVRATGPRGRRAGGFRSSPPSCPRHALRWWCSAVRRALSAAWAWLLAARVKPPCVPARRMPA